MESKNEPKSESHQKSKSRQNSEPRLESDTKTSKHAIRYIFVGITLTVFNYILYTILANLIFKNSELLWLSTLISTLVTTILAYIMHSKITWKERRVTKSSIYKFFIWNLLLTFPIGPGLTQFFSIFTPVYEFAFNICQNLHIDFSYEFVQSTGAFVFTTIVTMILNFLFYDKFVFGKKPIATSPSKSESKKEDSK